ncbi:rhomboid family intramembrane serine protease [Adhaeribacter sp. BT258]|uniref:Rhomboid family intramembrane serine protease n=1 Tax=Adhaeribacter terrigena TaxID=2793070 RepID=A0ABS1C5E4_9BACT|nr:rhomboid family intramembrane serine protease [Adhaeribacter terrigena]MBK0404582.1 rhomboid family intramembrane serine protease [Adhaeribacter terrigena]
MAFSLSHHKTRQIPLGDLTREQFLVLAIEAAQQADWSIGHTTANGFTAFTGFSLSSFSEEISIEIQDETALIKSECLDTQLYDWGKNKRNLKEFQGNFMEVQSYLTPETIASRYYYLQQENGFAETLGTQNEKKATPTFFSLFIPKGGYFITPILLNLNLLVFITMAVSGVNVLNPDGYSLLTWGANFQPKTLDGEIWRLLTACFLHIGIYHLLMNMYALIYIGSLLEPIIGRYRFLMAYLATGVLASLASVWWHPATIAAGASGAIFGMYGIFLALLTSNYIEESARKAFFMSIGIFVALNLLNGLNSGGIDNAAHFGGLISGIVLAFTFLPALKKQPGPKTFKVIDWLSAGIALLIVMGAYSVLPNNVKLFDKKFNQFQVNEARAIELYNFDPDFFKTAESNKIIQNGLKTWNENLKITEEITLLDLTEPYDRKNKMMQAYCQRRIQTYELMQKIAKAENPELYRNLFLRFNANLRWFMRELE